MSETPFAGRHIDCHAIMLDNNSTFISCINGIVNLMSTVRNQAIYRVKSRESGPVVFQYSILTPHQQMGHMRRKGGAQAVSPRSVRVNLGRRLHPQMGHFYMPINKTVLFEETIRFFHNFLASAKTLVDHSRIFVRETYRGEVFYDEYQSRISIEFKTDGAATFVHDLRNYILHKGIPLASFNTTVVIEKSIEKSVLIDVDSLRKWDNWSKSSK